MALSVEHELLIAAEVSREQDLNKLASICENGAVAIRILRDRIDELGGYHDDI